MSGARLDAKFDDGKDEGALRTIGEVAKALKMKPHVLRYWEKQFKALQPLKRSGGRRYYRTEDIALVERIDRLVNSEGYTLKGAAQAIADGPDAVADVSGATAVTPAERDTAVPAEVIAKLKAIRGDLAATLAR